MHFVMLEKKHRLEEARQLVITEELWDEMKKEL
jgi:hypothetical protein